ncbi:hypothetical protein [Aliikangiella maris]|uniref:Uncharacterized protein n=1 Tax=Aliikangiella maris TaxID=3162458 RepID=A0ABV2BYR1_9GAMM
MVEVHPNQLKLYKFHLWLAGIVFLLALLFMYWTWEDMTPSGRIGIPITFTLPTFLHLVLAYGAKRGSEISRKVSVGVGVLMLITFPIGTLIAFSFLPLTKWKEADDALTSTGS